MGIKLGNSLVKLTGQIGIMLLDLFLEVLLHFLFFLSERLLEVSSLFLGLVFGCLDSSGNFFFSFLVIVSLVFFFLFLSLGFSFFVGKNLLGDFASLLDQSFLLLLLDL